MGKLLGSLDLGLLIRTAFAGGCFFIAYHVTQLGAAEAARREPKLETVLLVSIFAGFTSYVVHRAVIYPLIECSILPPVTGCRPEACGMPISDNTVSWLIRGWRHGVDDEKQNAAVAKSLRSWADYTQFLYVSGLCIGAGTIAACIARDRPESPIPPLNASCETCKNCV